MRTVKYTIIQAVRKADWDIATPEDGKAAWRFF